MPDEPLAHAERGRALIALERLDEAKLAYARALALDPGHPKARAELDRLEAVATEGLMTLACTGTAGPYTIAAGQLWAVGAGGMCAVYEAMQEDLGRKVAVGEVDYSKLNVNGGSIAFGHPFGATGARVIAQALYELKRRGGGTALTTACAAGGIGAAMVLEVD